MPRYLSSNQNLCSQAFVSYLCELCDLSLYTPDLSSQADQCPLWEDTMCFDIVSLLDMEFRSSFVGEERESGCAGDGGDRMCLVSLQGHV